MLEWSEICFVLIIALGLISVFIIARNIGRTEGSKRLSQKSDGIDQTKQLMIQIRELVQSQVLNNHPRLFSAIAKQKVILNDNKRESIAIFISLEMFKELITNTDQYSLDQIEILCEFMTDLKMPVGFLGVLPIYIAETMKDTPVFVVGSISWSI